MFSYYHTNSISVTASALVTFTLRNHFFWEEHCSLRNHFFWEEHCYLGSFQAFKIWSTCMQRCRFLFRNCSLTTGLTCCLLQRFDKFSQVVVFPVSDHKCLPVFTRMCWYVLQVYGLWHHVSKRNQQVG